MQTIFEFFSNILDWCLGIFSFCLNWFLDAIATAINALLSPLAEALPDLSPAWGKLAVLSHYINFIDEWIAIKYGFTLLASYFAFILLMITIKLIIKLFVPCVG